MWIGESMECLFSYPYIYILMLLLWAYVIVRNNSIKNSALIIILIGILFALNYGISVFLDIPYIPYFNIIFAGVVFLSFLFGSLSFFFVSLFCLVQYCLFSCSFSNSLIMNLSIIFLSSIFLYIVYYALYRKLTFDNRQLISEQYTRNGYFMPDICLLNMVHLLIFIIGLIYIMGCRII